MTRFGEPVTLEGELVRLEPLEPRHAEGVADAVSDGELWRAWYTSIPSPADVPAEIARRLALRETGSMNPWAIVSVATGAVLGMTTFMNIDEINRRVEIGSTMLRTSVHRTGVNAEAKLLLLGYAFDTLGAIAVEFRTHWHNRQSRAAIERLGAKQDGVLRNHSIARDGSLRDTVVYSILPTEWPAVRMTLRARLDRAR